MLEVLAAVFIVVVLDFLVFTRYVFFVPPAPVVIVGSTHRGFYLHLVILPFLVYIRVCASRGL